MPALKITNPKISIGLVEELQDELAYQNEKAFSATHAFLRNVSYYCRDNDKYAQIPAKKIKEWFGSYNVNYKPCLDALEAHGLTTVGALCPPELVHL